MLEKNPEIIIVGAGPIGIAYAWGIKQINPKIEITILEKYQEYQRNHTLIMQHKLLDSLMKATGTENDPELVALLDQLKNDPHILTNMLQDIFMRVAKRRGVIFRTEEVKPETFLDQVLRPTQGSPQLLIGADGTHSVVSDCAFPPGNQIKHEFDYVLQLRYEIKGQHKAEKIYPITFYQNMAQHGLIANEYVGNFSDGRTTITMQMMISKQAFLELQAATSKTPLQPFKKDSEIINSKEVTTTNEINNLTMDDVPTLTRNFLLGYLNNKMKKCFENQDVIDRESIRISVNEAPATHAKQVFCETNVVPCFLVGDASLGLSYFKGLNAGLESAAKFFSIMAPTIRQGFADKQAMHDGFQSYGNWFFKDFAPKKVKEVEQYSTWHIRSFMKVMQVARNIKLASIYEDEDLPTDAYKNYFEFFQKNPLQNLNRNGTWGLYPHRSYDPVVKLWQFAYVPISHSLTKIAKLFIDLIKPYKSTSHFVQDLKQPLVASVNLASGIFKILAGIFTFNFKRTIDGIFTLFRGIFEVVTLPLLPLKFLVRGSMTLFHRPRIEENSGIIKVASLGMDFLEGLESKRIISDVSSPYKLLQFCSDLNRKYNKSLHRGQKSNIGELEELSQFNKLRADAQLDLTEVRKYFSLFLPKPKNLGQPDTNRNNPSSLQL
jgi:hypothetical protein